MARLSGTETAVMPEFHVQSVSGTRCRSIDEARWKMVTAAEAGASALLMVSGDGDGSSGGKAKGGIDSLMLIREAQLLREAGEIEEGVTLACVANPTAEGDSRLGMRRLEAKIEAGAEMVITQPSLIPERHRAWWEEVKGAGLDEEIHVIFGAAASTSATSTAFWMQLAGAEDLPGAAEVLAEWATHEAEMPREMFQAWCEEQANLFLTEALVDPRVDGVHMMPVTASGYAVAARLADTIQTLTELR